MKSYGITRTVFVVGIAALVGGLLPAQSSNAQIPGGSLDPADVTKYAAPLIIPPAMPRTDKITAQGGKNIDYYEIAVRQFEQQILPSGLPKTTVWSYGSLAAPGTVAEGGSFNYPAFTVETEWRQAIRVKWINDLVDENGDYLPHLLPVDQTLHWANPVGTCKDGSVFGTDCRGTRIPTVRRPGADDHPRPRRRHLRVVRRLPRGLVPAGANNIPADILFTSGSFYDTFHENRRSGLTGSREPRSSSTPTT